LWALPFCQTEWALTPPAVQDYIKHQNQQIAQLQTQIAQLQQQVETLQGRVEQTSHTSSKPPSSDSPFNKSKRHKRNASGKRGGQKGHRGKGPT
jgi:transposase